MEFKGLGFDTLTRSTVCTCARPCESLESKGGVDSLKAERAAGFGALRCDGLVV